MITVMFDAPGVTQAQYEEVCRLSEFNQATVPDGLIYHSASPTETGWLVVDVWENADKFKTFTERLGPALEKVGIAHKPQILKTHNTITGRVPITV